MVLAADASSQVLCPKCGVAILTVNDERLDADHINRHLNCPNCGAHEIVLKRVEQKHQLDSPIRVIDKYVTGGAFLTTMLAVAYGFFFRDVRAFRMPLLIVFLATQTVGSIWALLVATREMSLGLGTRVTVRIIWMTVFWGSFGIVLLVFTMVMIKSLIS